jgi:hypothetical protein
MVLFIVGSGVERGAVARDVLTTSSPDGVDIKPF